MLVDALIEKFGAKELNAENDEGRRTLKEDLFDCVTLMYDGYDIARELESVHGWRCTRAYIDVLDKIDVYRYNVLRDEELQWVTKNDVRPKLNVGDEVKFYADSAQHVGVVAEINVKRAMYVVKSSTLRYMLVLPYEEVEA